MGRARRGVFSGQPAVFSLFGMVMVAVVPRLTQSAVLVDGKDEQKIT
jgi:hypothetical protein